MSSTKAAVEAGVSLINSDFVSSTLKLSLGYQRPIFIDRLRVFVHAGGYYAHNPKLAVYRSARDIGADILPNDFKSSLMAAAGAGLEGGIYRFEWASFTVGGQYQVVYAKDWGGDMAFHHGWSSAVNVNLSKIAFPAFSIGLAQDLTNCHLRFALGMGMSM